MVLKTRPLKPKTKRRKKKESFFNEGLRKFAAKNNKKTTIKKVKR